MAFLKKEKDPKWSVLLKEELGLGLLGFNGGLTGAQISVCMEIGPFFHLSDL